MIDLKKTEAVFFDWDGTLVDSFPLLHAAHNYARQNIDMEEMSAEIFKTYFGKPRDQLYLELYGDRHVEAQTHFEHYITENHVQQLSPIEQAQELLEVLAGQGVRMGIVSNKKPKFVKQEIEALGWGKHFEVIIGSGDAPRDKPAPDPLLLAIEKLGFEKGADNFWFVGDTDIDLECARQATCPCVFLQNVETIEEIHPDIQPAMVIRNYTALIEYLLQCAEN